MEQFISFKVKDKTLRGFIHFPKNPDKKIEFPAIVFCHGFMGNKIGQHGIFVKAARYFRNLGFVVLRFDFSGCGDSDGSYEEITIDRQVEEAYAAIQALKRNPRVNPKKIFLIGLSMGGAVAALVAGKYQDEIAALGLWAPVAKLYEDIKGIVGKGLIEVVTTNGVGDYLGFAIGKVFISSLKENNPLEALEKFCKPILVIHGTEDQDVSSVNAELYRELRKDLGLLTEVNYVKGADHTFSSLAWEKEVFELTERWLGKTLKFDGGKNHEMVQRDNELI